MRRSLALVFLLCCLTIPAAAEESPQFKAVFDAYFMSMDEYVDKMKAGWIGQMVGVGWGGPTEFKTKGALIPEDQMPAWRPELVNQFHQDDIYVEMTFMRTLELYGLDVSIRQAGIGPGVPLQ